jgi:hypothetical protein
MKRSYLLIIAVLLLGLSIGLIVGGSHKSPLASSLLSFPEQIQLSSGETFEISPYEVTVSFPSTLIMGTISHVYVKIHPLGASPKRSIPSLTEGFQVNVESKLETTDAQIAPDGLIHAALKADQDTDFTWNITTDQPSHFTGTVWIYLAVQPKTSSSITEEQPLFAIPLDIAVSTVLGLRADLALVLGVFGSLIAIGLVFVALGLNFFKYKTKKSK